MNYRNEFTYGIFSHVVDSLNELFVPLQETVPVKVSNLKKIYPYLIKTIIEFVDV